MPAATSQRTCLRTLRRSPRGERSPEMEASEFSYVFLGTRKDGAKPPQDRFTKGPSLDGKAEFSSAVAKPQGQEPNLGAARPDSGAQMEQIEMAAAAE